mgnify:CR=1 FL=1
MHLPIAWLLLAFGLEIWPRRAKGEAFRACAKPLAWLCLLSVLPAAASGWLRADEMFPTGEPPELLSLHGTLMLVASGLLLLLAGARQGLAAWVKTRVGHWTLRGLLGLALLLMAWGAHLGGKLVYGADHLPW